MHAVNPRARILTIYSSPVGGGLSIFCSRRKDCATCAWLCFIPGIEALQLHWRVPRLLLHAHCAGSVSRAFGLRAHLGHVAHETYRRIVLASCSHRNLHRGVRPRSNVTMAGTKVRSRASSASRVLGRESPKTARVRQSWKTAKCLRAMTPT
eukprot:COSAG01_NODE_588_length_15134_cov_34.601796_2_plen_152_part_00